jgi:DNA-binding transcriptional ArsR family regulator
VRPGLAPTHLPTVELDPRTGYDFLTSASNDCGELADLLPEDRQWLVPARAALVKELGADSIPDACRGFVSELGRMLVGHPEIKTASQVVAAIDEMTDRQLLETMFGELLEDGDLGGLTRRTLDGDADAFAELRANLDQHKGHVVFTDSPADMASSSRRVLRSWLPTYEAIEDHIGRMLKRDVAARRIVEASGDPIGFVERTTNGIRLVPEPRIRRIVLAPTYFGRPYNSLARVGDVQLICYPIADSALGAGGRLAPPATTVRLYRALGDESRLRILRLLAEKDFYLTELANELSLSKPTTSHHLAQLRSAGLVTVTQQGNLTYYTLRRDRAEEAGVELRAYLAH